MPLAAILLEEGAFSLEYCIVCSDLSVTLGVCPGECQCSSCCLGFSALLVWVNEVLVFVLDFI